MNNTETAIATIAGENLPVVQNQYMPSTGLEDVRVRPTYLKIISNKTYDPKGASPGQILDVLTGQAYNQMTLVPLQATVTRTLFPPGADIGPNTKPLCKSNDGVIPAPYLDHKQAVNCKACPHSRWVNDKPAPCKMGRKFLVIDKNTMLPRLIQFTGLSATAASQFLETVKQYCIQKKYESNVKLDLYDFYFTLSVDKQQGKFGPVYVARFKDIKAVSEPTQFGPVFEEYVIRRRAIETEEEELMAQQKSDEAVDAAVIDAIPVEV